MSMISGDQLHDSTIVLLEPVGASSAFNSERMVAYDLVSNVPHGAVHGPRCRAAASFGPGERCCEIDTGTRGILVSAARRFGLTESQWAAAA